MFTFDEIRKHLISWAAFTTIIITCLKFLVMPWIQQVSRAESNKVLYVIYSQLAQEYELMPDKHPHQIARLSYLRGRQKLYRDYVTEDYKDGIISTIPE